MGYFSNLAIKQISYDYDRSYLPPEKQLLWRLEDLHDRLNELNGTRRRCEDRGCFSEDDLRYALPEHFITAADVKAAIALAIHDLADRYGIHIREDDPEEIPAVDGITGAQISFWDVFSIQACPSSPNAA